MQPNKRTRYWRTTTNSSTSRTGIPGEITAEQPVERPHGRRLVVRAFTIVVAVVVAVVALLSSCGGDSPSTTDVAQSEVAQSEVAQSDVAGEDVVVEAATTVIRDYDLQGHRGARGLRPENTLPAFELALDLMVDTLEFDLHLSADDMVIVWHDPAIDPGKCTGASASQPVREMTVAELSEVRCDQNPDPSRFPDQTALPGAISGDDYTIATLAEVLGFVQTYAASPAKTDAQRVNAASVRFNIETKRKIDDPSTIGDGFDGETMGIFETAIIDEVDAAGMRDRVTIQSFDHRSLWAIHAAHPDVSLAALTSRNVIPDFADLAMRGATIWSPDYRSVSPAVLTDAHDAGLLVVPWTVNEPNDMAELLNRGVDGIITDRPDLTPSEP